jgi:hypothetical protein
MNRILISSIAVMAVTLVTAQALQKKTAQKPEEEDLAAKVPEWKKAATEALAPYRYDASKVTYFTYQPYEQTKEVEVFFFNNTDYKISFNCNGVKEAIGVEIFDKPEGSPDRVSLYKTDAAPGKSFHCTSSELNKKASSDSGKPVNLKKAFISYKIPSKAREVFKDERSGQESVIRTRGAMVLAMGYSNV